MDIGINLLMWTPEVLPEHYAMMRPFKDAGYAGVELPMFAANPARAKEIGGVLRDEGLRSTVVTVMPGEDASCISEDPKSRQGATDFLKGIIDCCAEAGSEVLLGPFHQPLGIFSGHGPTRDEWARAAEVHRVVADHAQQAGVKLAIEWLNRFECYFLTTMGQAAEYVELVDHPNFATMFDTFHANIEEKDPAAELRTHLGCVAHVHISENDRGVPGSGHAAIRESLAVLQESGYEGWITIEAFGRALPELAAATRVWRDLFPHPDRVWQDGIRYIRECLGE